MNTAATIAALKAAWKYACKPFAQWRIRLAIRRKAASDGKDGTTPPPFGMDALPIILALALALSAGCASNDWAWLKINDWTHLVNTNAPAQTTPGETQ
jgi:hypothetical protein